MRQGYKKSGGKINLQNPVVGHNKTNFSLLWE